jgi:hypothetical protein
MQKEYMHPSIQGVTLLCVSWGCKRLTLPLTLTSKNQAGLLLASG